MELSNIQFIAIGKWNPSIFTPQWIIGKFPKIKDQVSPDEQVSIGYNIVEMSPTISIRKFEFNINYDRLVISCSSENKLGELEHLTKLILLTLEHTPIKAIGLNFNFTNSLDIFETSNLGSKNYVNSEFREFRELEFYTVTKIHKKNKEQVAMNYNFNFTNKNNIQKIKYSDLLTITKEGI